MDFLSFFTSSTTLDILFKLFLAFVLSSIVGIERELIHKPAGIKTHSLICISATLTMAIGVYMKQTFETMDPSRLPAQILAGIGFVGAGTIIRDGFSVKGITTAASLLAITCIGLAIGAGFYEGAIFATILVFFILSFTAPVQDLFHKKRKHVLFNIETTSCDGLIGKAEDIFNKYNTEILSIQKIQNRNLSSFTYKVFSKCSDAKFKENILNELCKIDGVTEVYTSKRFYKQDAE